MARCQDPHAQPGIPQKCRSSRRRWYGVSHWSSAVGMSSARSPQRSVKTLIRIGPAMWNPPESSNPVLKDAISHSSSSVPPVRDRPGRPRRGATCHPGPPVPGVPGPGRAAGPARQRGPWMRAGTGVPSRGVAPRGRTPRARLTGRGTQGVDWRRTRWTGDQTEPTPAAPTEATWPPPHPRRPTLLGADRPMGPGGRTAWRRSQQPGSRTTQAPLRRRLGRWAA